MEYRKLAEFTFEKAKETGLPGLSPALVPKEDVV